MRLAFRHRVDELVVEQGHVVGVNGSVLARSLSPRPGELTRGGRPLRPAPALCWSRAAESAATSIWFADTGRSGSARRRARWSPASRPALTAAGWRSLSVPEPVGSGATVCGTTPRGSATGTRCGKTTASASSGALVAVVRRDRQASPGTAVPGLRHGRDARPHRTDRPRAHLVHPQSQIIAREFALSGSEQNPDITGKRHRGDVRSRLLPEVPGPIPGLPRSRRGLRRRRQPP